MDSRIDKPTLVCGDGWETGALIWKGQNSGLDCVFMSERLSWAPMCGLGRPPHVGTTELCGAFKEGDSVQYDEERILFGGIVLPFFP